MGSKADGDVSKESGLDRSEEELDSPSVADKMAESSIQKSTIESDVTEEEKSIHLDQINAEQQVDDESASKSIDEENKFEEINVTALLSENVNQESDDDGYMDVIPHTVSSDEKLNEFLLGSKDPKEESLKETSGQEIVEAQVSIAHVDSHTDGVNDQEIMVNENSLIEILAKPMPSPTNVSSEDAIFFQDNENQETIHQMNDVVDTHESIDKNNSTIFEMDDTRVEDSIVDAQPTEEYASSEEIIVKDINDKPKSDLEILDEEVEKCTSSNHNVTEPKADDPHDNILELETQNDSTIIDNENDDIIIPMTQLDDDSDFEASLFHGKLPTTGELNMTSSTQQEIDEVMDIDDSLIVKPGNEIVREMVAKTDGILDELPQTTNGKSQKAHFKRYFSKIHFNSRFGDRK